MAPGFRKGQPKFQKTRPEPKSLKRKRDEEDIAALQRQVDEFDPGDEPPTEFAGLPFSEATKSGLKASSFETLTPIQAQAIPSALRGNDILGAARTGSGKTLAFLIPVLENLYRKRWTEYDGLGALILSPTRELAIQIFEVLRKIGRNHTFSAGLVIGGKSLQEERERLGRMNILVATPGRLLQHLDQTADLEIGNLQMLILDEADRIMDMGFKETVDAIVAHLPPAGQRQTMLFSATQTKRVSDLARLSLKDPQFVSVNEAGKAGEPITPDKLQQNYVVTPLPEKLDVLWSFIRSNLKSKTLVFLSSGKQVRFVYESLRHLQPGIPLLYLHGRQKQTARLDITTRFSRSQTAVLFATDVAARGLDFPAVDWVVQVDCPEDVDTYIHRVGRTARYQQDGRAIIMLDPSEEEGMLNALAAKKIIVEKINVREKKQTSIKSQLQNMCFKDPELKYLGQKAFVSYVRSIHIQKNKDIFKVKELQLDEYASSMGLPGTPRVKFINGEDSKAWKNRSRQLAESSDDEDGDGDGSKEEKKKTVRTKYDRMFERQNQDILADHYTKLIDEEDIATAAKNGLTEADDDDDDFLSVKRRFDAGDAGLDQGEYAPHASDGDAESKSATDKASGKPTPAQIKKRVQLSDKPDDTLLIDSNRRAKLLKSKKALLKFKGHGSHMHFDEDGVGHEAEYYEKEEEFTRKGPAEAQREEFLKGEREWIADVDVEDKEVVRNKRKEKKIRRKERERAAVSAAAEQSDDDDGGEGGGGGVAIVEPGAENIGVDLDTLDYADLIGDDNDSAGEKQPAQKRQKKWFEDASSSDEQSHAAGKFGSKKKKNKGKSRRANNEDEPEAPQTLEDLEAMALGVLQK